VAGLISKLTGVGSDLDDNGYSPCPKAMLELEPTMCYGLMRVPVNRFSSQDEMEKHGPYSEQSIAAGIEYILEIAQCVCESTKLSLRKTVEDVIMISKSNISWPFKIV